VAEKVEQVGGKEQLRSGEEGLLFSLVASSFLCKIFEEINLLLRTCYLLRRKGAKHNQQSEVEPEEGKIYLLISHSWRDDHKRNF